MSDLYTLAVWTTDDAGGQHRELLNPDWRMPYQLAESEAARLTRLYASVGRRYVAINVNE